MNIRTGRGRRSRHGAPRRGVVFRRLVGLVRAAVRENGIGPAIWILMSFGAIAAGGLTARELSIPQFASPLAGPDRHAELSRKIDGSARLAPADAAPLLQRAYLERVSAGQANGPALLALRRSYELEPYGPDATVWRLRFTFDHWTTMPVDLRQHAIAELETAFPRHGWAMRSLPMSISDPTGRMAAALTFERLRIAQYQAAQPVAHSAR